MFYNSTRNSSVKVSSAEAITQGISAEGGLFVPESIPEITFDDIKKIGEMKYADRAAFVFSKFLTDFTEAEIHYCTDNAYSTKNFESDSIAEIAHLFDGTYMLELWHRSYLCIQGYGSPDPALLPHNFSEEDKPR